MKNLLILLSIIFIVPNLFSQGISINNTNTDPHESAMLDVSSTSKGVLIPRMTKAQRDLISPLTVGLMVFQTDQSPGFYCYNGSSWDPIGADILAINDLVDGISDGSSVFLGEDAGINDDGTNFNVGVGIESLKSNTMGNNNTAVGYWSLRNNSSGWRNNALGHQALRDNTSGSDNIAIGSSALRVNNGNKNIALGYETMNFNTSGIENIALGYQALRTNVGGNYNNAIGVKALYANTASGNTAVGHFALHFNSSGTGNVGLGYNANYHNQTGSNNTIIGYEAGRGVSVHDKSNNIFLGYQAGYNETSSNKLYIENSNSSSPLIGGDFDIDELYLNGKVGINTMSPLTQLQVNGNITFAPAGLTTDESRFIGQSIFSQSTFEASNGFGGMEVENFDRPSDDDSAQQLHFWTHHQGYESARRMTIDTVGFVGVGTESPDNILEAARDGAVSSIISTTYRPSGYSAGSFIGRAARGTKDSPSAVQEGDYLASFNARGYGDTGFSSLPRGRLVFNAAQNWTDAEQGSNMIFETVPLNTTSDQERMRISSQGNVGIGTVNIPDPQHKLHIVQDSTDGNALMVTQYQNQDAATVDIPNASSTGHSLNVYNAGSGYGLDLVIRETGTGPGGRFTIDNNSNNQPAIYGEHNGVGNVAQILADYSANANSALFVSTLGTGPGGEFQINNPSSNSPAVKANTIGTGSAGVFTISDASNAFSSIFSSTSGIGNAGRFQINNTSSTAVALFAKTNGTGPALGGNNEGDGVAGFFNVLNNTNTSNAFEVKTLGLGSATLFKVDNALSIDPVVVIEGNGSGPSLVADNTIDMAGFRMATGATSGHVLTSDGSGVGTWQASSFDFSDGGEVAGMNRTLGNTDSYALSFITNNTERVKILNDGKVGIGSASPKGDFQVNSHLVFDRTSVDLDYMIGNNLYYDSGWKYIDEGFGSLMTLSDNGTIELSTSPSGLAGATATISNKFYLNNAGNIGIGTTTPTELLQIEGGQSGNHFGLSINQNTFGTGYPALFFKDESNNKIASILTHQNRVHLYFRLTAGDFVFDRNDGSAVHMILKDNGNLGVGTTTPDEKLHVAGNARLDGSLEDKDGDAGSSGQLLSSTETGTDWISSSSIVEYSDGGEIAGADRTLGNTDGFALGFLTNGIEQVHIDASGNVGFGTTNPSGILDIAGNYHFPSTDGTANQVLKTDGSGSLTWTTLVDNVGATQINELSDGKTGGGSIFLGSGAGLNDDGSNNYNTGVGQGALVNTVTGSYNTALGVTALGSNFSGTQNIGIGHYANYSNRNGSNNTIIGYEAGRGTSTHDKSGNVFLGYQAGYYETGSNKLYIANSKDTPPLIYGDFNSTWLTVHGTLDINEAYHFPTTDGIAGEALLTNGSGSLSWATIGSDYSDGGDARGKDRSLGNTDAFDLSIITNDASRLIVYDDGGIKIPGNVGINTEPDASSSINKTLGIFAPDGVFSNAILDLSGVNSSYIQLESRRTGSTNGKNWRISSGSGSVSDLDKFMIYNPDDGECITIRDGGNVGIGTTDPKSSLQVNGGVQVADDSDAASAYKVGTLRYRTETGTPNKSFVEMCMQTGASTYEWVIIKENSW